MAAPGCPRRDDPDGDAKKRIRGWVRFSLTYPHIRCGWYREPDGSEYGCKALARTNPRDAYQCEACPLPRADPGPEIRGRFRLYQWLHEYQEGTVKCAHRWRLLQEGRSAFELDGLMEDLAAIDDTIEGIRQAQAELDTKRRAG